MPNLLLFAGECLDCGYHVGGMMQENNRCGPCLALRRAREYEQSQRTTNHSQLTTDHQQEPEQ